MRQKALKSWLLDRIEDRAHWFDVNGNPTVTTLPRLTERLSADEDFASVAELYAPRQDLAKTVRELLTEEHVPFISALRYKPSGLKKRADWEHVWDLQREEDAAPDEPAKREVRKRTPVPPKYSSADFLKPSYWRARGKLDVPKERFVSYGTVNAQSPGAVRVGRLGSPGAGPRARLVHPAGRARRGRTRPVSGRVAGGAAVAGPVVRRVGPGVRGVTCRRDPGVPTVEAG